MASINNNPANPPSGNAQLIGIVSSVPMPNTHTPTLIDGTPVMYNPLGGQLVLGSRGPGFTVTQPIIPGSLADMERQGLVGGYAAAPAGAPVVGGGDTAPPMGAQPPAPTGAIASNVAPTNIPLPGVPAVGAPGAAGLPVNGTAGATAGAAAVGAPPTGSGTAPAPGAAGAVTPGAAAAATPAADEKHRVKAPAPGTPASAGPNAPQATAVSVSGFGRADRGSTMKAKIGEATFSFPSFNSTKKTTAAPKISWGAGWKRVDKGDGFFYMQHANGTKAVPAVEWRMTPSPLDGAKTIKVAHGWGKKFPDGTVLVFDKTEGPYVLDPKGNKKKIKPGMHEFGGVKVRIFEASVVRVLEKSGAVSVFDSRGNHGAGTPRKTFPDGAAQGGGGAKMIGNEAPVKAGGPSTESGPVDEAKMTAQVQKLTGVARGLLQQIQAGKLDPAALAAFQAELSTLPDGIRQAIGAAGITTGDAASLGIPPTTTAGGPSTASGGGDATPGAPVAGVDANPNTKQIAAGTQVKVSVGAADIAGITRFGQLPDDVQEAIAAQLGSTEGTGVLEADVRIKAGADGTITILDSETAYLRKKVQIAGGGPGEDLAMTMKPVRQSSPYGETSGAAPAPASGGGRSGGDDSDEHAIVNLGTPALPTVNGTTVAGGGAADSATRRTIFKAGEAVTIPALASAPAGSFTWGSLPAQSRQAILDWLAASPSSTAGAAWAARGGDGDDWMMDPAATIVIGAGQATFMNGLTIARSAPAPAPTPGGGAPAPAGMPPTNGGPVPPSGPSSQPVGHNATVPPVAPASTPNPARPAHADGHDHAH